VGTRAAATRQALRTPRAAAIAGIAFALLLATALVLIRSAVPAEREAGEVLDESGRRTLLFALNLLPFAGIAFLWFIGVVRDRVGEGEDRLFATVFLGSGLLFVGMLFVAGAMAAGLLTAPDTTDLEPTSALWSYGRRISFSLLTVYAMRMAGVFMISTTTVALRLGLVPKWLAVVGYTGAVVLLVTVGTVRWTELIFPGWVLVLSVQILVVTLRARSAVG
jgi:hypothetical protein